jgi:hypothetical protein
MADFFIFLGVALVALACIAYKQSAPTKLGRYDDFNQAYWTPQPRGDDDGVD